MKSKTQMRNNGSVSRPRMSIRFDFGNILSPRGKRHLRYARRVVDYSPFRKSHLSPFSEPVVSKIRATISPTGSHRFSKDEYGTLNLVLTIFGVKPTIDISSEEWFSEKALNDLCYINKEKALSLAAAKQLVLGS